MFRVPAFVLAVLLAIPALAFERGCGARGGPGFRSPEGKCVGWKNLKSICGDPPSTRCTYEGAGAAAAAAVVAPAIGAAVMPSAPATAAPAPSDQGSEQPKAVPRGFTGFNVRRVVADSLACASQMELAKLRAGDGGFGTVRVRVPERKGPVWIERALVLGR